MKPRITLVTLGVDDLERGGLLPRLARVGNGGHRWHGVRTWCRGVLRLAARATVGAVAPRQPGARLGSGCAASQCDGRALTHNVGSKEDVDVVMGEAGAAGPSS